VAYSWQVFADRHKNVTNGKSENNKLIDVQNEVNETGRVVKIKLMK